MDIDRCCIRDERRVDGASVTLKDDESMIIRTLNR